MGSGMVNEGNCVKCGDTCLIVNEIRLDSKGEVVTSCVKDCSWVFNKVVCDICLGGFNNGKRYKKGQLVK